MSEWYYGRVGTGSGPVSPEELRRLLADGTITPETMVWCPAEGIEPTPLKTTAFVTDADGTSSLRWHYEQIGARVGPVDEGELLRLFQVGLLSRDTLVWNPKLGAAFVRLGDTALLPQSNEPPALPVSAINNSEAWVLVAIPLIAGAMQRLFGTQTIVPLSWASMGVIASIGSAFQDQKRVARSGAANKVVRLRPWVWLPPAYLLQRARALHSSKILVWAWLASFVAAWFIAGVDVVSVVKGDVYLWADVPACDSGYEVRQVQKVFNQLADVKAAGVTANAVMNARELGASGDVRTCSAQVDASDTQTYAVIYTVEKRADGIMTTINVR